MSLWDRPNGPATGAANSATQTALNQQAAGAGVPLAIVQNVVSAVEVKIATTQNPLAALSIQLPPDTTMEQTIFDVVASGYIQTRAASTVAIGLYADAGATVTAGNLLHKTAAPATQNTAIAPWFIRGQFIYDSVSGKLTGKVGGMINNVLDPEIAVTNVITGISNVANPVLNFSLSVTASGATVPLPVTINVQKFNAG